MSGEKYEGVCGQVSVKAPVFRYIFCGLGKASVPVGGNCSIDNGSRNFLWIYEWSKRQGTSKKSQIQIQRVDYLENYMTNRLTRNREGGQGKEETSLKGMETDTEEREISQEMKEIEKSEMQNMDSTSKNTEQNSMEEDMEMLKRLLSQVENGESQTEKLTSRIAASEEELKENEVFPDVTYEAFSKQPEESELELLEEFVQSFLA